MAKNDRLSVTLPRKSAPNRTLADWAQEEDQIFLQSAQDALTALMNPNAKTLPDGTRINRKVSDGTTVIQVQDPQTRQWRDVIHQDRKTGEFKQGKGLITSMDATAPEIFQSLGMPYKQHASAFAQALPSGAKGATETKPDATETKPDATETKPDATKTKPDATKTKPDVAPVKQRMFAADSAFDTFKQEREKVLQRRLGGWFFGMKGRLVRRVRGTAPESLEYEVLETDETGDVINRMNLNTGTSVKRALPNGTVNKITTRVLTLNDRLDAMSSARKSGTAYTGAANATEQSQQDLAYKKAVYEHNKAFLPDNMQNLTDEQLGKMSLDQIRGGYGKAPSVSGTGTGSTNDMSEAGARTDFDADSDDEDKQAAMWGGWSRRDMLRSLMSAMKAGRTRRDFRYRRCL